MSWHSVLLLGYTSLHAAPTSYQLDWFSIDGGNYVLAGSIGQADPGPLVGANYQLNGGSGSVITTVCPLAGFGCRCYWWNKLPPFYPHQPCKHQHPQFQHQRRILLNRRTHRPRKSQHPQFQHQRQVLLNRRTHQHVHRQSRHRQPILKRRF